MKWYVVSSGQDTWVPEVYDSQQEAEEAVARFRMNDEGVCVIKGEEIEFEEVLKIKFTL